MRNDLCSPDLSGLPESQEMPTLSISSTDECLLQIFASAITEVPGGFEK